MLCGGVGAARFLNGLVRVVPAENIVAIVNVADDFRLHGLEICPDIDTIRYTLSNDVGTAGWGRRDETWTAMAELGRLADSADGPTRASAWFSLGDRDLATHLYRTQRLAEGVSLTSVTRELNSAAGVDITVLPCTEDAVHTYVTTVDGETLDFQEYFVGRQHDVDVASIDIRGANSAAPAPGVLEAIAGADSVVIAPSNPLLSIAPILQIPAIGDAVTKARHKVTAVSPIVDGSALKGPAARLLENFGYAASVESVAAIWKQYCSTLMIDPADAHLADAVETNGIRCCVHPLVMSDIDTSMAIARAAIGDEVPA